MRILLEEEHVELIRRARDRPMLGAFGMVDDRIAHLHTARCIGEMIEKV